MSESKKVDILSNIEELKTALAEFWSDANISSYQDVGGGLLVVNIHQSYHTNRDFMVSTLHKVNGVVGELTMENNTIRLTKQPVEYLDIHYHEHAGQTLIVKITPDKLPQSHDIALITTDILSVATLLHSRISNCNIPSSVLSTVGTFHYYYRDGTVNFSQLYKSGEDKAFMVRLATSYSFTTEEFRQIWAYIVNITYYQPVLDLFLLNDNNENYYTLEFKVADGLTLKQYANLAILVLEAIDTVVEKRDYQLKDIIQQVGEARAEYFARLSEERQGVYQYTDRFSRILNIR